MWNGGTDALLTFTNHMRSLLSFSVGHYIYRLSIEGRKLLLSFDMVGRLTNFCQAARPLLDCAAVGGLGDMETLTGFTPLKKFH